MGVVESAGISVALLLGFCAVYGAFYWLGYWLKERREDRQDGRA